MLKIKKFNRELREEIYHVNPTREHFQTNSICGSDGFQNLKGVNYPYITLFYFITVMDTFISPPPPL